MLWWERICEKASTRGEIGEERERVIFWDGRVCPRHTVPLRVQYLQRYSTVDAYTVQYGYCTVRVQDNECARPVIFNRNVTETADRPACPYCTVLYRTVYSTVLYSTWTQQCIQRPPMVAQRELKLVIQSDRLQEICGITQTSRFLNTVSTTTAPLATPRRMNSTPTTQHKQRCSVTKENLLGPNFTKLAAPDGGRDLRRPRRIPQPLHGTQHLRRPTTIMIINNKNDYKKKKPLHTRLPYSYSYSYSCSYSYAHASSSGITPSGWQTRTPAGPAARQQTRNRP